MTKPKNSAAMAQLDKEINQATAQVNAMIGATREHIKACEKEKAQPSDHDVFIRILTQDCKNFGYKKLDAFASPETKTTIGLMRQFKNSARKAHTARLANIENRQEALEEILGQLAGIKREYLVIKVEAKKKGPEASYEALKEVALSTIKKSSSLRSLKFAPAAEKEKLQPMISEMIKRIATATKTIPKL